MNKFQKNLMWASLAIIVIGMIWFLIWVIGHIELNYSLLSGLDVGSCDALCELSRPLEYYK